MALAKLQFVGPGPLLPFINFSIFLSFFYLLYFEMCATRGTFSQTFVPTPTSCVRRNPEHASIITHTLFFRPQSSFPHISFMSASFEVSASLRFTIIYSTRFPSLFFWSSVCQLCRLFGDFTFVTFTFTLLWKTSFSAGGIFVSPLASLFKENS